MRAGLLAFCAVVLAAMLTVTTRASMQLAVWDVGDEYWGNLWAVATLCDAYFAFFFFYLWVLYKERGTPARLAWLLVIVLTGTMGMAVYLALHVLRLRRGEGARELLGERRPAIGAAAVE